MTENYKYYTYNWSPPRPWVSCDQYTSPAARYHFWVYIQDLVIRDLDKLSKEGWEPAVADLPSGVQLRSYKALRYEVFGWIMIVLIIFSSFGLGLLFLPFMANWYYEPTGYEIQLRKKF